MKVYEKVRGLNVKYLNQLVQESNSSELVRVMKNGTTRRKPIEGKVTLERLPQRLDDRTDATVEDIEDLLGEHTDIFRVIRAIDILSNYNLDKRYSEYGNAEDETLYLEDIMLLGVFPLYATARHRNPDELETYLKDTYKFKTGNHNLLLRLASYDERLIEVLTKMTIRSKNSHNIKYLFKEQERNAKNNKEILDNKDKINSEIIRMQLLEQKHALNEILYNIIDESRRDGEKELRYLGNSGMSAILEKGNIIQMVVKISEEDGVKEIHSPILMNDGGQAITEAINMMLKLSDEEFEKFKPIYGASLVEAYCINNINSIVNATYPNGVETFYGGMENYRKQGFNIYASVIKALDVDMILSLRDLFAAMFRNALISGSKTIREYSVPFINYFAYRIGSNHKLSTRTYSEDYENIYKDLVGKKDLIISYRDKDFRGEPGESREKDFDYVVKNILDKYSYDNITSNDTIPNGEFGKLSELDRMYPNYLVFGDIFEESMTVWLLTPLNMTKNIESEDVDVMYTLTRPYPNRNKLPNPIEDNYKLDTIKVSLKEDADTKKNRTRVPKLANKKTKDKVIMSKNPSESERLQQELIGLKTLETDLPEKIMYSMEVVENSDMIHIPTRLSPKIAEPVINQDYLAYQVPMNNIVGLSLRLFETIPMNIMTILLENSKLTFNLDGWNIYSIDEIEDLEVLAEKPQEEEPDTLEWEEYDEDLDEYPNEVIDYDKEIERLEREIAELDEAIERNRQIAEEYTEEELEDVKEATNKGLSSLSWSNKDSDKEITEEDLLTAESINNEVNIYDQIEELSETLGIPEGFIELTIIKMAEEYNKIIDEKDLDNATKERRKVAVDEDGLPIKGIEELQIKALKYDIQEILEENWEKYKEKV